MSGAQGPGAPGSRGPSNGPPSATMPAPAQHPPPQPPPGGPPQSSQNLNQIVLEYLNKKGYNKTEAQLRKESEHTDANGQPIVRRAEDAGGPKYMKGFDILKKWIEDNLDLYKYELERILWPVFVYSFLLCVKEFYIRDAEAFFNAFKHLFQNQEHEKDLILLSTIRLPEHVDEHPLAKLYLKHQYRLTFTKVAFNNLTQFLEAKESEGGAVVIFIIQTHLHIKTVERAASKGERSIAAMLARGLGDDLPPEDEGIPGHNPGSANISKTAPEKLPELKLARPEMEPELMEDVRTALQDEDAKNPPRPGQNSLEHEFEQHIKREPNETQPPPDQVPLPPSVARDVAMEIQKVRENRDRFRIEGRSSGVGPGVSVTMFTFHNSFDSVNCIDFSGDNELVAVGTAESYVRIWTLSGKALPDPPQADSSVPPPQPSSSRRLIGHSGPVYAVSFSPSTVNPYSEDPAYPSTDSRYLLSASQDKTIRLWSLDTWTCLVAYRAHDAPVWDVCWSPYGHYFASASHDRTARVWATNHIEPLRICVGHDTDVDVVCWHPNGAYVFTGSGDRSVRMWVVGTGVPVRMYTGHTGNITAIACSPAGQTIASGDDLGNIIIWDLHSGRRMKRMRGHGKGGIWSLSFSAESTVLVSGGADGTVRVWDVLQKTSDSATAAQGKVIAEGGTGTKIDGGASGVTAGAGAKKGKKGDVATTADQISAFPTKKSPVYKVAFTRMNLVLAGGAYLPLGTQ